MSSGAATAAAAAAAAAELVRRRREGRAGGRLEPCVRPDAFDDGFAVQCAVAAALGPTAAWKAGLPSAARPLGVLAPIPALSTHDVSAGARAVAACACDGHVRIEPELALVFGDGLALQDAPHTAESVRAAVTGVRLALELIGSRFQASLVPPPSYAEQVADSFMNDGLALGPAVADCAAALACAAMRITLSVAGVPQLIDGAHPTGDPLLPAVHAAEALRARGIALAPQTVIITGSYAGILAVPVAEPVVVRFAELGELSAVFEAAAPPFGV